MKKLFITSFSVLGLATINAQNTAPQNIVTLNIKLSPIQTLIVDNNKKEVNLAYASKDDYANGVTSTPILDQLTVYSTGGFDVKVKSSKATLESGGKNLNANTIKIIASAGTKPVNGATYAANVMLSNNEAVLVSSTKGGVDNNISIEYKGASADAYLDNYVAGQNPTIYTTDVVYTILAK